MSKNQSAVLIAEDNAEIAKLIKLYLEGEGYKTVWAEDGAVGLAAARNEAFSAVLVDIMMPKMNGYELIREIRAFSDVPILILSAKNEDNDKILGLNIGADDYITKPFSPLEVQARVRSHLRRYTALGGHDLSARQADQRRHLPGQRIPGTHRGRGAGPADAH